MLKFVSFLKEYSSLDYKTNRIIVFVFIAVLAAFTFFVCSFKVSDYDIWWHLKAGEIMLRTHSIITTEPFSYVRFGQPYVAIHEWLAQVVFAFVFSLGGFIGLILLRVILVIATLFVLFFVSKKHLVLSSLFLVYILNILRNYISDRPQLFSFLFFSIFLVLAIKVLDKSKNKYLFYILFPLIQALWVNMHGGAAIMGNCIMGLLLLQKLFNIWRLRDWKEEKRDFLVFLVSFVATVFALLISPSTYKNIIYLLNLANDNTVKMITEWQPHAWGQYLKEYAFLWVLSFTLFIFNRRHFIFFAGIIFLTGVMSRMALRHEAFLLLAFAVFVLYQLDNARLLDAKLEWISRRRNLAIILTAAIVIFLSFLSIMRYKKYSEPYIFGFGSFEFFRGAYDFVEKNNIRGNMYNSYNTGCYLLYRGYPDRKVFIDGRNVDYGFNFMIAEARAKQSPEEWKKLVNKYNFDYAIFNNGGTPSVEFDNEWVLVYLDDWASVYVKNEPENYKVIDKYAYKNITVTYLLTGERTTTMDQNILVKEFERALRESPKSRAVRKRLAKLYFIEGRVAEAEKLIKDQPPL